MSQDEVSSERSRTIEQGEIPGSPKERLRRYVNDVRLEMRLVSWPTWEQVRSTTFIVLFFTFAMAAFVGALDWICLFLYRLLVERSLGR